VERGRQSLILNDEGTFGLIDFLFHPAFTSIRLPPLLRAFKFMKNYTIFDATMILKISPPSSFVAIAQYFLRFPFLAASFAGCDCCCLPGMTWKFHYKFHLRTRAIAAC